VDAGLSGGGPGVYYSMGLDGHCGMLYTSDENYGIDFFLFT
jgi:hypothetical protein